MPAPFTIATDADWFEERWWRQWAGDRFPCYEAFWVARIVPLTCRVKARANIRFQTTPELVAAGYNDEDVAVAQLHCRRRVTKTALSASGESTSLKGVKSVERSPD